MSAHAPLPDCDSAGHCITCSDEGVAMRVLRVDRERSLAVCMGPDDGATGGEEVAIDLVEPVAVGQRLLVHAGVALANLGYEDATRSSPVAHESSCAGPAFADRAIAHASLAGAGER